MYDAQPILSTLCLIIYHLFPLKSCQTFTANLFKNPLVSITGSMTLMNVEAKTQMNDITIQPVKKPREKM